MYCRIQKKSDNFAHWNAKTFLLTNCELIQYKQEVKNENFEECNEASIKQRFNIYQIEDIQLGKANEPFYLSLKFQKRTLKLQWKERDQPSFIALYRILCATQKQTLEDTDDQKECAQRPLPSNICFALYILLQSMYKHKDVLRTRHIFKSHQDQKDNSNEIRQLYENLIVKGRKFISASLKQPFEDDIHLQSQTLLYTLRHMPTSLLCDAYSRSLATFVARVMEDAERDCMTLKAYHTQLNKLPKGEDRDILMLNLKKKEVITKIKNEIQKTYTAAQYKEDNGFALNNRYGFMTILFSLLSNICSHPYHDTTAMSAHDLAVVFAEVLQSKQYSFECRRYALSNNKAAQQFKAEHAIYKKKLVKMLKILIYFAQDIFPSLRENKWKVRALVFAQAMERSKVHEYNGHYSRDVKNEYFIGTALRHKTTDHGKYFEAKYHIDDYHTDDDTSTSSDSSDSHSSSEEHKYNKRTLQVPKQVSKKHKKVQPKYKVLALPSVRNIPQTHSDIGISSDEELVFEPDSPDTSPDSSPEPKPKPVPPKLEVIEDYEEKYEQQVLERTDQDIEYTVYHNGDTSVRSILSQCEICFYSPLLKLFDRTTNRNRNANEHSQRPNRNTTGTYKRESNQSMDYVPSYDQDVNSSISSNDSNGSHSGN